MYIREKQSPLDMNALSSLFKQNSLDQDAQLVLTRAYQDGSLNLDQISNIVKGVKAMKETSLMEILKDVIKEKKNIPSSKPPTITGVKTHNTFSNSNEKVYTLKLSNGETQELEWITLNLIYPDFKKGDNPKKLIGKTYDRIPTIKSISKYPDDDVYKVKLSNGETRDLDWGNLNYQHPDFKKGDNPKKLIGKEYDLRDSDVNW